jgi:hypothetical protein
MTGSQAESNQSTRIWNTLALPALVRLVTAHGLLGCVVPLSRRLATHIMLAEQSLLDLAATFAINRLLPAYARFTWLLAAMVGRFRALRYRMRGIRRLCGRSHGHSQRQHSNQDHRFVAPTLHAIANLAPPFNYLWRQTIIAQSPGSSPVPLVQVTITEVYRPGKWSHHSALRPAGAPGRPHLARSSGPTGRGRNLPRY